MYFLCPSGQTGLLGLSRFSDGTGGFTLRVTTVTVSYGRALRRSGGSLETTETH